MSTTLIVCGCAAVAVVASIVAVQWRRLASEELAADLVAELIHSGLEPDEVQRVLAAAGLSSGRTSRRNLWTQAAVDAPSPIDRWGRAWRLRRAGATFDVARRGARSSVRPKRRLGIRPPVDFAR